MTTYESIVAAPRLVGEVNSAGIAALKVDKSMLEPPSSTGSADTSRLSPIDQSGDDWSATPSSLDDDEDYDELRLKPETTIDGSRGGGIEKEPTLAGGSAIVSSSEEVEEPEDRTKETTDVSHIPKVSRRTSIQVTLEKTDKKGRYILTADDPTVREILRRGIEREAVALDPTKARKRFRDLVFTRQFTAFDRQNPLGSQSPFRGFFTVFWLTIGLLLLKIAAQNYRVHGSVFGGKELLKMMFERDLIVLGLTDGFIVGITVVGVGLQKIILKGYISWNGSGWIIQNIWQTFYLFAVVGWTLYREWPWTHTIFIVLHGIVFLMKQHSYAFYNGYLSQVYRRKKLLEEKLDQLGNVEPVTSPVASPPNSPNGRYPAATALDQTRSDGSLSKRRRRSGQAKASTNLQGEQSEIAPIARAIEAGTPLDSEQLATFNSIIRAEIRSLDEELKGKCTVTDNHYPKNLTLANWADWTPLPTLVYELEYPRSDKINWWYVAEKTAAVFGVIWVMMVISQAYIYPTVAETVRMKEAGMSLAERWREFPWIVSDILFPLLLEQLLSWYVIWECCLNVLAELTRFADRGFYGDWWNSVSWDQYARDWNRPVHTFLLRHVYHSSISAFHLNKLSATFVTFLLSALVHELIMWCLFKKFRGYLFVFQLSQIPLTMVMRMKPLRGKDPLNNITFWLGKLPELFLLKIAL